MFEGFSLEYIELANATSRVRYGGACPPVLLLHRHPRTHATWSQIGCCARNITRSAVRVFVASELYLKARRLHGSRGSVSPTDWTSCHLVGVIALGTPQGGTGGASSGSRTVNSLPWSFPSQRTSTNPPWAWTRSLTKDRPTPKPPPERSGSSCVNRSKITGSKAASMPIPVSSP
jgi:hypothetical protein